MLWSCGGGSAGLSLSLSARGVAPAAVALVYVGSLLATPLHTALLVSLLPFYYAYIGV